MHNSLSTTASQPSLLAIDTAFDICSVALVTPTIADCRSSSGLRKHADDVLPMINALLSAHEYKISSLQALAMVSGPGSFTGLRIGTAVTQGLAFGADLPVVCVSSLALMARAARHQRGDNKTVYFSCLHARENEFYFGAYQDQLISAPTAVLSDTVLSAEQISQSLSDLKAGLNATDDTNFVLAGTGWQHEYLQATTAKYIQVDVSLDALLLAEMAIQYYQAGRAVDGAAATPAYLKDDMEYRTV